jgi:hypothetical protein
MMGKFRVKTSCHIIKFFTKCVLVVLKVLMGTVHVFILVTIISLHSCIPIPTHLQERFVNVE